MRRKAVRLRVDGKDERIALTVRPLAEAEGHALVVFEEADAVEAASEAPQADDDNDDRMVAELESELTNTRESLQTSIEELETSNEELRASNEELQSVNEELQSTTEELETGKEELQSTNEELLAVNQELRVKNDELARSYADLNNFIASADVGTLFLDRELMVRRYTPRVTEVINIIPSDVGRPLAHLTSNLEGGDLTTDAAHVLRDLAALEKELATTSGRVYQVRLRPYRDTDDKIGGIVITFIDISGIRQAEVALRASEERFRALVTTSSEVIYRMSADWDEMTSLSGGGFLADTTEPSRDWFESYIPSAARPRVRAAIDAAIRAKGEFELEHQVIRDDGTTGWTASRATPICGDDGGIVEWFGAAIDITDRKRHEADLALLAEIGEELAHLTSIDATMDALGAKIGGHFDVSSCTFAHIDEAADTVTVAHGWNRPDVPGVLGVRRASEYMSEQMWQLARDGKTMVIRDAQHDARVDAGYAGRLHIGSFIAVPLFREGTFSFTLTIHDSVPRNWRDDEIALLRELAARIWIRLERARAEVALEQSESRYRTLFDSIDQGFCIIEMLYDDAGKPVDYRFIEVNPAFQSHTGLVDATGRTVKEMVPEQEQYWFDIYGKVAASGEAVRFQQRGEGMGRTFDVNAFRIGAPEQRRVAVLFADITERELAVQHRELLIHELNHRVKNTLATVQALAEQTFHGAGTQHARETFEARLLALSAAHDVLTRERWQGADMDEIARHAMAAWTDDGVGARVRIQGPDLRLCPEAALALAMALHELATNASKYGALSNPTGEVSIQWQISNGSPARLQLHWHESGGPPVHPPSGRGFGSRLIEHALARDLGGTVDLSFDEDGVRCAIDAPLDELREQRQEP